MQNIDQDQVQNSGGNTTLIVSDLWELTALVSLWNNDIMFKTRLKIHVWSGNEQLSNLYFKDYGVPFLSSFN